MIVIVLLIITVQCGKTRSWIRRREFIQDEIRKNLFTSITSLKGEITDVILDEMMEYYNTQTSKLYRLEKEFFHLKNFSLPMIQKRRRFNDLVKNISQQQRSLTMNLTEIQIQLNNLTEFLQHRLHESRSMIDANDLPIGREVL